MCRIAETGTGKELIGEILQSDRLLGVVERMMPHDNDGRGDLGKMLTPPRWHPQNWHPSRGTPLGS